MPRSRENTPAPRFRSDHDRLVPGERPLISVQPPLAGADWLARVPGGRSWRLRAGAARIVAGAAVANRLAALIVSWQGITLWNAQSSVAITAGQTLTMQIQDIANPLSAAAGTGTIWVDCPDFWIPEGATIATSTAGIQGADQWSLIGLYVEERWETDADIELRREMENDEIAQLLAEASQPTTGG